MQVTLYNNSSDPRYLNKNITQLKTVQCKLLEPTDHLEPSLTFEKDNYVLQANYMYIPDLGRYYYIIDIIFETNNRIRVNTMVDVLMSYKDQLNNSYFIITRSSMKEVYNLYLNDPRMGSQQNKQIQQKVMKKYDGSGAEVDNEFEFFGTNNCYVLTAGAPEIFGGE